MRGGAGGMWIWLGRLRGRFIDLMGAWFRINRVRFSLRLRFGLSGMWCILYGRGCGYIVFVVSTEGFALIAESWQSSYAGD